MALRKLTFFLLTLLTCNASFLHSYRPINTSDLHADVDVGKPLILTPFLKNGQIEAARNEAMVTIKGFESVPSYSGYFTVDEIFDSNLFFWFIPSQGDYKNDPVILWLQGGPGGSSLFALFIENGPYIVTKGDQLSFRSSAWTQNHSMIYIDNPAGTGFSFTNGGYAKNQTKVGEDLYQALYQFFTLFPELQSNPFFVSGESYAGKYIPAIGYTIHKKNPTASLKINLQGLLIGDGLIDPEHQIVKYADYLFELGFIDENAREIFYRFQNETVELIRTKNFLDAFYSFDAVLNGDFTSPTLFKNVTGFDTYFNYLFTPDEKDVSYQSFLQTPEVRKAIHVGNISYSSRPEVETNLREDFMDTVAPWVSELLSNYRINLFNGQLDIIVAYTLTRNFLNQLEFSGAEEYKTAPRKIWKVGDDIAGYVKVAGNLTEVLVRNAGHMVPSDQPIWAYDLVYKFVRNIPLA